MPPADARWLTAPSNARGRSRRPVSRHACTRWSRCCLPPRTPRPSSFCVTGTSSGPRRSSARRWTGFPPRRAPYLGLAECFYRTGRARADAGDGAARSGGGGPLSERDGLRALTDRVETQRGHIVGVRSGAAFGEDYFERGAATGVNTYTDYLADSWPSPARRRDRRGISSRQLSRGRVTPRAGSSPSSGVGVWRVSAPTCLSIPWPRVRRISQVVRCGRRQHRRAAVFRTTRSISSWRSRCSSTSRSSSSSRRCASCGVFCRHHIFVTVQNTTAAEPAAFFADLTHVSDEVAGVVARTVHPGRVRGARSRAAPR